VVPSLIAHRDLWGTARSRSLRAVAESSKLTLNGRGNVRREADINRPSKTGRSAHVLGIGLPRTAVSRTDAVAPNSCVLVLIVGLQDADKIGHAGSILVFGHSRNLSIGRGLAPLPKPH
jgi:hypothetical protein